MIEAEFKGGLFLKKYVCDNYKLEIKNISDGKFVQVSIGFDVEDDKTGLGTDLRRHYCISCVQYFEDQQWQFVDVRRK